jgi:hypothetical protein
MDISRILNPIWIFLFVLQLMLFAVLVVSEDGQQQGVGSLLVSLDQLGPVAITAANKLTFGTGIIAQMICKFGWSNIRKDLLHLLSGL